MKTWAYSLQVSGALGRQPRAGRSLTHVAHLRVSSHWYAVTRRRPPGLPSVRVEFTRHGGSWAAWPPHATERVTGSLLALCLRMVRRRNRGELARRTEGAGARRWPDLAQAYTGPS